jgi:hypothetical protein
LLCGYPLKSRGYDGAGILSAVIMFNKNHYHGSICRF